MALMKSTIKTFAMIYFIIGSAFGAILEMSYVYADFYLLWNCGLSCIFTAATSQVWGAIIRAFLWLPSLVTWYFSNLANYSFLKWLAPGFFIQTIH